MKRGGKLETCLIYLSNKSHHHGEVFGISHFIQHLLEECKSAQPKVLSNPLLRGVPIRMPNFREIVGGMTLKI